jgi:hypothetical protein
VKKYDYTKENFLIQWQRLAFPNVIDVERKVERLKGEVMIGGDRGWNL